MENTANMFLNQVFVCMRYTVYLGAGQTAWLHKMCCWPLLLNIRQLFECSLLADGVVLHLSYVPYLMNRNWMKTHSPTLMVLTPIATAELAVCLHTLQAQTDYCYSSDVIANLQVFEKYAYIMNKNRQVFLKMLD